MTSLTLPSNLPTPLADFLTSFYHASDLSPHTHPSSHASYTAHFHPTATLIMGPSTFRTSEAITGWRTAGWVGVSGREHHVTGVFPGEVGEEGGELMLYGDVGYEREGGRGEVDWAARMVLKTEGGKLGIAFYQVYLTIPKPTQ